MSSPLTLFNNAWERCDILSQTYAYTASVITKAFDTQEILRAEWVARVSALDMYVHELIASKMLEIYIGSRTRTPKYDKFTIPHSVIYNISLNPERKSSIYDIEVRRQLGFQTFQTPEAIADGIKLISEIELWKKIAENQGALPKDIESTAKNLKHQLNSIVDRRNKIAHEGDMKPLTPREPWPISQEDLNTVKTFISNIVSSINTLTSEEC